MFREIVMIDYSKPLAKRKRKHAGPYRWTPQQRKPGTRHPGRAFYQHSRYMAVDSHGSTFDLRLDYANTHAPVNWRRSGTFSNPDGNYEYVAIIARLPSGRGFLAGWTMGNGMLASLDGTIYETIEDAASAAYDEAERACKAEQEARDNASLTAPSAWASYLINGDASGIDDDDKAAADAWIAREGKGMPVSCYDAGFMRNHDAWQEMPLAADCQHYEFAD
jgi:hypothetical protein